VYAQRRGHTSLPLADELLPTLLDDFHAREILHVTFGSVLQHPDLKELFFAELRNEEETYYKMLETHFGRHFAAFEGARPTNLCLSLAG